MHLADLHLFTRLGGCDLYSYLACVISRTLILSAAAAAAAATVMSVYVDEEPTLHLETTRLVGRYRRVASVCRLGSYIV